MNGGYLRIIDGHSYVATDFYGHSIQPSLIYFPWDIYCRETGYDKTVTIISSFDYNSDDRQIIIDEIPHDVEKAEGNTLNISLTSTHQNINGENILEKTVSYYTIRQQGEVNTDNLLPFNTEQEAKLAVVKMMRQYFGDFVNVNDYLPADKAIVHPVINLALMEEDLAAGRYSEGITSKYMDDENSSLNGRR